MAYKLNFSSMYKYDDSLTGITVGVVLKQGDKAVDLDVKVDTGATHCIFRKEIAEALCLNIENGIAKDFVLANGSILKAYGHEVNITILDINYDTIVYFAINEDLIRDVLGRNGFLYLVRLALIDYDSTLYLSKYDEV